MPGSQIQPGHASLELAILEPYLPATLIERLRTAPAEVLADELAERATYLADLLRAVATYVPEHIVREQVDRPEPGRVIGRVLTGTTLFADVSGFTAMSERLSVLGKVGAEEITRIVNDLFSTLLATIFRYGGSLFKFGGDALAVFFSGEAHAQRATAAALLMQAAMVRFASLDTRHGKFTLGMSVGVHSGDVFVAEVGLPERIELVATGESINETARAESAAETGQVFISRATRETVGDIVEVRPADEFFEAVRLAGEGVPESTPAPLAIREDGTVETLVWLARRIDALRRYLGAGLFDKIAFNPRRPDVEAELRPVTVVFANFSDFSEILKDLGPERVEEATAILNRYFTRMQSILHKYGGIVNKVDVSTHGDKLMALFGAPIASENDPERAVRAALEMQEAMAEFAAIDSSAGVLSLTQRIGVNTGQVFAGNVGSPVRKEYSVMGDEVNLTARLMATAAEGQILISRSTWRKVHDHFDLKELPPVRVKGKSAPVAIFAVEGARAQLRREREQGPIDRAPMVGRQAEVERVQAVIERALAGEGQVLGIVGEAGTGKSRLIEELEAALHAQAQWSGLPIRLLFGECQSFGKGMAYLPVLGLLKQFFSIPAQAAEQDAVLAVERKVNDLAPDMAHFTPLLAGLLSLPIPENDVTRGLSGDQRRDRAFELVRDLLQAEARRQPLAIILEDLQWLDSSSFDLLTFILPALHEVPALVVAAYRPEFLHNWAERIAYTEIALAELTDAETIELVKTMLGLERLPEEMERLVVQKSQGNPFFIEEVVKALAERGVLQRGEAGWDVVGDVSSVEIPDTIQGLIIARIDQLEERNRQVLQVASVLGRRFSFQVLEGVYPLTGTLGESLADLVQLDLLQSESGEGEPIYVFRQAMTQEVTYDALLYARRREYHGKAGEQIERIYVDRLLGQYELLAYHYDRGEHWPKALEYSVRAGEKAKGQYANKESLSYYGRVLEILDHPEQYAWREAGGPGVGADHESVWRRTALLGRGDVLSLLGEFDQALSSYEQAVPLADDPTMRAEALWRMGETSEHRADYAGAVSRLEEALESLSGDRLSPLAARIRATLARVYARLGKLEQAQSASLECLAALAGTENFRELAQTHNVLGGIAWNRGDWDLAIEQWSRGAELTERLQDPRWTARLFSNLGVAHSRKGDQDGAIDHLEKALAIMARIGDVRAVAMLYNNLGGVFQAKGDIPQAVERFEQALVSFRRLGDRRNVAATLNNLGEAYRTRRDFERAVTYLREALDTALAINAVEALPLFYRQLGEAHLDLGEAAPALEFGQECLRYSEQLGNKLEAAMGERVIGRAYSGLSDFAAAEEHLVAARQLFGDLGNVAEAATAELDLARLLLRAGRRDEAMPLLARVRQMAVDLGLDKLAAEAEAAE